MSPLAITRKEVAAITGLSIRTILEATHPRGSLPVIRSGRACRYDPRDVQAWLETLKQGKAQGAA